MNVGAQELAALERGDFADLTVEGRREQWHVNKRFEVGAGGADSALLNFLADPGETTALAEGTVGVILQQADADHEWLVMTVLHDGDEYEFGRAAFADEQMNKDEFTDPDIVVHSVASALEDLRGS